MTEALFLAEFEDPQVGDEITLADFSVGACFSYAEPSGLPMDSYTHIKAWLGRLNEVPAWKNTAPKFG